MNEKLEKFKERFNVICTLDNDVVDGYETGMVTAHIKKIPFADFPFWSSLSFFV